MSLVLDSQEEGDLSQRDLFAEALSSEQDPGHYAQGIPQNVGNEILKTLMKLEKNLEGVMKDVAALKRQQNDGAFSMETCTFKKRLNVFLKEKFSRCPWLKTQSDLEFKNEVRKCLKQDNFQTNTLAYRSVNQWATTRFTEYRNQLRRKLMSDIKNGKDVQAMPLQEFCKTYLESYASSASVDVGDSPERIQVSLVLRSFTHSQKLNVEGSDELEFFTDFWAKVMEYYDEVTKKDDERKWDKLKMLDNRRMTQRQAAQQPGNEM
ncbi:uncharacterized protein LOC134709277 [Mytilus trossulus]|uniref:uncharacterized protein LOC134709277 n=1 Tax=Mytilus trossulus TaxID=6551 RepID=UPI0030079ED4